MGVLVYVTEIFLKTRIIDVKLRYILIKVIKATHQGQS